MHRRRLLIQLTLVAFAMPCCAQYRVSPGDVDADGLPTSPARICLGSNGSAHCYTPPDYMKSAPFGLNPKAEDVGELNGAALALFRATFSGGGSGALTSFALLTVKDGEFVNLLPKVQLSNQSEYKLWSLPEFSGLPVLATADFVWDFKAGKSSNSRPETHFGQHRYEIQILMFDPAAGRYLERIKYITTRKYPGLDEAGDVRVLDLEKRAILTILKPGPSR